MLELKWIKVMHTSRDKYINLQRITKRFPASHVFSSAQNRIHKHSHHIEIIGKHVQVTKSENKPTWYASWCGRNANERKEFRRSERVLYLAYSFPQTLWIHAVTCVSQVYLCYHSQNLYFCFQWHMSKKAIPITRPHRTHMAFTIWALLHSEKINFSTAMTLFCLVSFQFHKSETKVSFERRESYSSKLHFTSFLCHATVLHHCRKEKQKYVETIMKHTPSMM